MEKSGSLPRMSEHVDKVMMGLRDVESLLQQKGPTVKEAGSILKVCACTHVCLSLCVNFILVRRIQS